MTDAPTICRLCGSERIQRLGSIPDSDFFAGRVLPAAISGGGLWRCQACRSMFRHPILAASDYLRLYAEGIAEAWTSEGDRLDLAHIRRLIAQHGASGRVLDVGCGSGGFLQGLPASFEKSGIEPSIAARDSARAHGVSLLGHTVPELAPQVRFDVITVIDVIEHVVDPAALLDQIVLHLAPGGCLIVSTADPDNPAWRGLLGARFWYSSFPEHISFPSAQFFRQWQQHHGLQPPVVVRTRYRRRPLWQLAIALAAQAVYWLSPTAMNVVGRSVQRLRGAPRPHRRYFSGGGQGVFTDHQVVMITTRGATRSPAS